MMTTNNYMVPDNINDNVKLLLKKITSSSIPIYIPYEPIKNAPLNECIPLVKDKVKSDGGEMILGWQIWQSKLLIESEFHAVWKAPNGDLIDISPKPFPLNNIMFVEDTNLIYERKQINSIRINTTNNSIIDDFIIILDSIFKIENKENRATEFEVSLNGREAEIYKELQYYKKAVGLFAQKEFKKNDKCWCGSEIKYKSCHGKKLRKILSNV